MKFFHSEDQERVIMAVEAALTSVREHIKPNIQELAAVAVSEEVHRR